MKKLLLLPVFISILVNGWAQNQLEVNRKAPEINITDWIANVPGDKSLERKYIILEFWATWCAPCLAAVPHINELQTKFADRKDLYFLSISDEKLPKIQSLLKRTEMTTKVVADQTGETFSNFDVKGIPKTILIDNKGIIKWIGHPYGLSEELISNFIADKPIPDKFMILEVEPSNTQEKKEDQLYYQLEVIKGIPDVGSSSSNKWSESGIALKFENYRLRTIISNLKQISEKFIIVPKSIEYELYTLNYFNPKFTRNINNPTLAKTNSDNARMTLLKDLLNIFNLEEVKEKRMEEVYVIEVADESKLEISDEETGHMSSS
ncbi:MAG: TlpA disulfide reductase family protein, partial [Saprospiraceae bacterium]|nr:TlpA disulfide reductase family protein [Saprospiraceae bacterium]